MLAAEIVTCEGRVFAYGVARLETSFAIWQQSVIIFLNILCAPKPSSTYNVDTTVARNSNDAVERAQVNAHYRHVYRRWRGISGMGSRECMRSRRVWCGWELLYRGGGLEDLAAGISRCAVKDRARLSCLRRKCENHFENQRNKLLAPP